MCWGGGEELGIPFAPRATLEQTDLRMHSAGPAQGLYQWLGPPGFPDYAPLPWMLVSSYLAMARKANSTFMPVLALVSMKGTPYSCQGEGIFRTHLCLSLPLALPKVITYPGQCLSIL